MTDIRRPEAVVRKVVPQEKAATFMRRGFTGINGPGYRHAIPDAPPREGEPPRYRPGVPSPWRPDPLMTMRGGSLGLVVLIWAAVVIVVGVVLAIALGVL